MVAIVRQDFLARGGAIEGGFGEDRPLTRKCRDCENAVVDRNLLCGPCRQEAYERRATAVRGRYKKRVRDEFDAIRKTFPNLDRLLSGWFSDLGSPFKTGGEE
jgi:hypothetical protein